MQNKLIFLLIFLLCGALEDTKAMESWPMTRSLISDWKSKISTAFLLAGSGRLLSNYVADYGPPLSLPEKIAVGTTIAVTSFYTMFKAFDTFVGLRADYSPKKTDNNRDFIEEIERLRAAGKKSIIVSKDDECAMGPLVHNIFDQLKKNSLKAYFVLAVNEWYINAPHRFMRLKEFINDSQTVWGHKKGNLINLTLIFPDAYGQSTRTRADDLKDILEGLPKTDQTFFLIESIQPVQYFYFNPMSFKAPEASVAKSIFRVGFKNWIEREKSKNSNKEKEKQELPIYQSFLEEIEKKISFDSINPLDGKNLESLMDSFYVSCAMRNLYAYKTYENTEFSEWDSLSSPLQIITSDQAWQTLEQELQKNHYDEFWEANLKQDAAYSLKSLSELLKSTFIGLTQQDIKKWHADLLRKMQDARSKTAAEHFIEAIKKLQLEKEIVEAFIVWQKIALLLPSETSKEEDGEEH